MDFSGNSPANVTASWHPEPTTRGSFTILSSCIITLTLCVWKAVHLNLPEHESCLPKRKKTDVMYWMTRWITLQKWRKVGWLILGILAPEMVAFTAWSQRREAQKLKDAIVQKLSGTPSSLGDDIESGQLDQTQSPIVDDLDTEHSNQAQPPTDDRTKMHNSIREARDYFKRNPWTITHCFYAVMGGYAIDTSTLPENQKFLPGSRDRLTLTLDGLEFLAEERPDLLPRVPRAEIQDKSKADTFAKAIITVQASFFIIQCLYRLIRHLPISLLELNTFAHTLCALLTYALWWEKPLEVAEPTLIPVDESRELWAVLCFRVDLSGGHTGDWSFLEPITSESQAIGQLENTNTELHLREGETLGNLRCSRKPRTSERKYQGSDYWVYTPRDRLRWSLVSSSINGSQWGLNPKFPAFLEDPLFDRAANWPPGFVEGLDEGMTDKAGIKLLVAFTLAGLSYGALHLLAWGFPFASHAEHLLWQISGLTVAASGLVFIVWKLILFVFDKILERVPDTQEKYLLWIFGFILGAYILLYIFARTYLIVESFISFVYLPDAAFQQPQWTYYFPHIS